MITLRRATIEDFEEYKSMFQDTGLCWTFFKERTTEYTKNEDDCKDPELRRIAKYFDNFKQKYFEEKLKKEHMFIYIIYDDENVVGYVDIDCSWTLTEKTSEGKRVKVARYHIGHFGLNRELIEAKKAEVVKQITELNLPNMKELVILAMTDESQRVLIANGFTSTEKGNDSKSGFYMKTWSLQEVQARKKRKRKG